MVMISHKNPQNPYNIHPVDPLAAAHGQDAQSRQSVHDELRRLDIDPKDGAMASGASLPSLACYDCWMWFKGETEYGIDKQMIVDH